MLQRNRDKIVAMRISRNKGINIIITFNNKIKEMDKFTINSLFNLALKPRLLYHKLIVQMRLTNYIGLRTENLM
jgi:hypothetical protein